MHMYEIYIFSKFLQNNLKRNDKPQIAYTRMHEFITHISLPTIQNEQYKQENNLLLHGNN